MTALPTGRSFRRTLKSVPGFGFILRWIAAVFRLPNALRHVAQHIQATNDRLDNLDAGHARLSAAFQLQQQSSQDSAALRTFVVEQLSALTNSVSQELSSRKIFLVDELRSHKEFTLAELASLKSTVSRARLELAELASLKSTVSRARLELTDLSSQFREHQMASRRWDAVSDLVDATRSQLKAHYGLNDDAALVPHILGLLHHLEQEVRRLFEIRTESAQDTGQVGTAHEPARLSCYLGDHRLLTRTQRGLFLVCSSRDLQITPAIVSSGLWEETTSVLFELLLPAGGAYLEVGANIGYFTTLAATYVGHHGLVYAFEPNPDAFAFLEENVRINRQTYLSTLRRIAVAERSGTRTMHSFVRNMPSSTLATLDATLLEEMGEQPVGVEVDCTTLDDEFRNNETQFDFLKIDAEGSEPLVIAGAKEFLRRNLKPDGIILLEWNPIAMRGLNTGGDELLSILQEGGFSVFKVLSRNALKTVRMPEDFDDRCNADLIATRAVQRLKDERFQVD